MNLQGTKKKGCAATMNLEWIQLYPDFQVPFHASACLLLTVFFDGSRTLLDTSWSPAEFSWSAVEDSHRFISAIADSAHLPHVQNWTLDFNWETQSAATSLAKPPIKDQQSPHAICGLGSCATARLSNLALFIMQVFTEAIILTLLPAVPFPSCMPVACASWPHANDDPVAITTHLRASTINGTTQSASPSLFLDLGQANQAPSSSTAAFTAAINPPHLCDSFRGLSGCASSMSTNPLLFAMQVCASILILASATSPVMGDIGRQRSDSPAPIDEMLWQLPGFIADTHRRAPNMTDHRLVENDPCAPSMSTVTSYHRDTSRILPAINLLPRPTIISGHGSPAVTMSPEVPLHVQIRLSDTPGGRGGR
ncbi:uncharacterized protein [Dermacentor albipictus]|uniref:uncharacterized protein isoform X2 n=1 Tax=Dermacentor albipictus TaxID=60249 RepID=UPI0038FC937C